MDSFFLFFVTNTNIFHLGISFNIRKLLAQLVRVQGLWSFDGKGATLVRAPVLPELLINI